MIQEQQNENELFSIFSLKKEQFREDIRKSQIKKILSQKRFYLYQSQKHLSSDSQKISLDYDQSLKNVEKTATDIRSQLEEFLKDQDRSISLEILQQVVNDLFHSIPALIENSSFLEDVCFIIMYISFLDNKRNQFNDLIGSIVSNLLRQNIECDENDIVIKQTSLLNRIVIANAPNGNINGSLIVFLTNILIESYLSDEQLTGILIQNEFFAHLLEIVNDKPPIYLLCEIAHFINKISFYCKNIKDYDNNFFLEFSQICLMKLSIGKVDKQKQESETLFVESLSNFLENSSSKEIVEWLSFGGGKQFIESSIEKIDSHEFQLKAMESYLISILSIFKTISDVCNALEADSESICIEQIIFCIGRLLAQQETYNNLSIAEACVDIIQTILSTSENNAPYILRIISLIPGILSQAGMHLKLNKVVELTCGLLESIQRVDSPVKYLFEIYKQFNFISVLIEGLKEVDLFYVEDIQEILMILLSFLNLSLGIDFLNLEENEKNKDYLQLEFLIKEQLKRTEIQMILQSVYDHPKCQTNHTQEAIENIIDIIEQQDEDDS